MDWVARLCYVLILTRSHADAHWFAEASPWLASLPTSFLGLMIPDSDVVLQDDNDGKVSQTCMYILTYDKIFSSDYFGWID